MNRRATRRRPVSALATVAIAAALVTAPPASADSDLLGVSVAYLGRQAIYVDVCLTTAENLPATVALSYTVSAGAGVVATDSWDGGTPGTIFLEAPTCPASFAQFVTTDLAPDTAYTVQVTATVTPMVEDEDFELAPDPAGYPAFSSATSLVVTTLPGAPAGTGEEEDEEGSGTDVPVSGGSSGGGGGGSSSTGEGSAGGSGGGGSSGGSTGATGGGGGSSPATEGASAGGSQGADTPGGQSGAAPVVIRNPETFRPAQLVALSPQQVATIAPSTFGQLLPSAFAALTPSQAAAVTPEQASAIRPARAAGLTPRAVAALDAEALTALRPSAVSALSAAAVGAMTAAQLRALTPRQVAALRPKQLVALTAAERALLRR